MKKIKIMMLSLALFAVVGAALAFKAKFNTVYCTAATTAVNKCPADGFCPLLTITGTTNPNPAVAITVCTQDAYVVDNVVTCTQILNGAVTTARCVGTHTFSHD